MIEFCHIVPKAYLPLVAGRPRHLVLAHLIKQDEVYRNFYKNEAKNGATIILDNSNYELGNWTTPEDLVAIYDSLESPNVYLMAPEEAFNSDTTIEVVRAFVVMLINKMKRFDIKTFGTIHGTTYEGIKKCYQEVSKLVDLVGFSYRLACPECTPFHALHNNADLTRSVIRVTLLERFLDEGIIDKTKDHHLLGLGHFVELKSYTNKLWIKSVDSSLCYVYATDKQKMTLGNYSYKRTYPHININIELDKSIEETLIYNIRLCDHLSRMHETIKKFNTYLRGRGYNIPDDYGLELK